MVACHHWCFIFHGFMISARNIAVSLVKWKLHYLILVWILKWSRRARKACSWLPHILWWIQWSTEWNQKQIVLCFSWRNPAPTSIFLYRFWVQLRTDWGYNNHKTCTKYVSQQLKHRVPLLPNSNILAMALRGHRGMQIKNTSHLLI